MNCIMRILLCALTMVGMVSCGENKFEDSSFVDSTAVTVGDRPVSGADAEGSQKGDTTVVVDPEQSGVSPASVTPGESGLKVVEATKVGAGYAQGTLNLQHGYSEISFKMGYSTLSETRSKTYTQEDRQIITKNYEQGTAGTAITENFTQNNLGIIDILAVVDNSGSMSDEHDKLKTKLPELLSAVKDSNWKLKVVSTDINDSCETGVITKDMTLAVAQTNFENQIDALGTNGAGKEQGVNKAIKGLKCVDNWIRESSSLVVLIVSDEDNCSTGVCSGSDPDDLPATLISTMASNLGNSQRTVGQDAKIYGLIRIPGDNTCNSAQSIEAPVYRNMIVNDSSSYVGSICDADYTTTFQTISSDMSEQLTPVFELAQIPVLETLKIYVNEVLQEIGEGKDVTVSGKTLTFATPPPDAAQIRVEYNFGATPRFSEVDLGEIPGKIEEVTITPQGGTPQQVTLGDQVNLVGTKLVFAAMPVDSSAVTAKFRRNTPALINEFSIDPMVDTDKVVVKVNDVVMPHTLVTETGMVSLVTVAPDAASIKIDYEFSMQGPEITTFVTDEKHDKILDLKAWDAGTGDPLEVSFDKGSFIFRAEDFSDGRDVMVRYRGRFADDPLVYSLPYSVDVEALQVTLIDSSGAETVCSGENISVKDQVLSLDCDIADLDSVRVEYRYDKGLAEQVFDLKTGPVKNGVYTVWVNNEKISAPSDYEIKDGGEIVINKSLPPLSEVKIRLEYLETM